ncbi:hypothetical protein RSAG8_02120, partial [Rhizoctonia solani AG-8 WAC10335]
MNALLMTIMHLDKCSYSVFRSLTHIHTYIGKRKYIGSRNSFGTHLNLPVNQLVKHHVTVITLTTRNYVYQRKRNLPTLVIGTWGSDINPSLIQGRSSLCLRTCRRGRKEAVKLYRATTG